jgi:hypothetical protein
MSRRMTIEEHEYMFRRQANKYKAKRQYDIDVLNGRTYEPTAPIENDLPIIPMSEGGYILEMTYLQADLIIREGGNIINLIYQASNGYRLITNKNACKLPTGYRFKDITGNDIVMYSGLFYKAKDIKTVNWFTKFKPFAIGAGLFLIAYLIANWII